MKPLPVLLAAAAIGAVVGVVLGTRDVGTVETRFYPPARQTPAGEAEQRVVSAKAEVDAMKHDFGKMQRGTSESHEFIFTNTGGSPLVVEVLKTTCKCTVGDAPGAAIRPGESAPVRLEWVAKTVTGPFRQEATIRTNDPWQPNLKLTVEGRVVDAASLKPGQFAFGRTEASDVARASVYVMAFEESDEPLAVTAQMADATRDPERYRLSVERVDPAETGAEDAVEAMRIDVEAGPGLPIGSLLDWVQISTNLPKPGGAAGEKLELQAPILATVVGEISVRGAKYSQDKGLLNMGKVTSAEGREAKLFLSCKGKHAATLRGELLEADPEWLEVEFEPPAQVREGVGRQFFTIRIPPGRPPEVRSGKGEEAGGLGDGDARLRLSTGHPTTPELDVKVRFVIAE